MLFSALSNGGLNSVRSKLKKTPVTTLLKHDGSRVVLVRGEDGTEREEALEEKRPEDLVFLKLAASDNGAEQAVGTVPQPRRLHCDEDLLDASECARFSVDDLHFLAHLQEHGWVRQGRGL